MSILELAHLCGVVERETDKHVQYSHTEGKDPFLVLVMWDSDYHDYVTLRGPGGWTYHRKVRAERANKRAFGVCA